MPAPQAMQSSPDEAGPVLLLGWSARHESSERAVILDALARIESNFKLVVLSESGSSAVVS